MKTNYKSLVSLFGLLSILIQFTFSGYGQTVTISGELRKWDKVQLSFMLPGNDFTETDSTFKNNRVDVLFTNPKGDTIRVPGFFAADGNAANTSAKRGKVYKAFLRPDQKGIWKYQVLYYSGTDVVLMDVNQLPKPTYNITGEVGVILENNKSVPDLKAKGRLQYQNAGDFKHRRYLKFAETGEYFLKLGPDSPENFLDYNDFDFDAVADSCDLCSKHFYKPHAIDYKEGDPTWKGEKGKDIMGAINYLRHQQMNSISMSLFGGDDKNVFPWTTLDNKFIFDVSKLEQWEIVLDHIEENGFLLHFKLAENENWDALTLNQIKVYYREMVARFGHHLALEWNIAEEYRGTPASAIPKIDWLASIDPWQNHRVIHTYPDEHHKYDEWLRLTAKLTGASVQSSQKNAYVSAYDGPDGILTWIDKSKGANQPWVIASDEQNPGSTGIFTSEDISVSTVKVEARKRILWKTLIAGGAGVMWYGGGQGDFKTENFNRFSTLFTWSRYAILDFFKGNAIKFWETVNRDDLVSDTANCLAQDGQTYIIYLENGGSADLNLSRQSGVFSVKWFDPRNGGDLKNGTITSVTGGGSRSIGNAPDSVKSDWVVLITKKTVKK